MLAKLREQFKRAAAMIKDVREGGSRGPGKSLRSSSEFAASRGFARDTGPAAGAEGLWIGWYGDRSDRRSESVSGLRALRSVGPTCEGYRGTDGRRLFWINLFVGAMLFAAAWQGWLPLSRLSITSLAFTGLRSFWRADFFSMLQVFSTRLVCNARCGLPLCR